MVKLPTMPPPGARISTLTVATPSSSATAAENKTLDPASTGSGVSVAPVTLGGSRSTTSKVPACDAQFPAASESHTVNAWVPTSAVVYEYAYTPPPDVDIVKFPMTTEEGS